MTVELLPGAKMAPEVLLHQVLEDAGTLRGVLVVTLDVDEKLQVSWSNMPVAYLAMAAMAVDEQVRRRVMGDET